MKKDLYLKVSGLIFLAVALLHLARLVKNWELLVNSWQAPMWASGVGLLVAGYLAFVALSGRVK